MDPLDRSFSLEGFGRFGKALLRHGALIIVIVVLVVIAAAGLSLISSPTYQAESWLLVRSSVLTAQGDQYNNDVDAMSRLIASSALEARVLANPKSARLPAAIRHPALLINNVDVRADAAAHVIKIVASQPNPAGAALLANIWAEESQAFLKQYYLAYIDVSGDSAAQVNKTVSAPSNPADTTLLANLSAEQSKVFLKQYYASDVGALVKQQADVKAQYENAEKAYQDYLAGDPIPDLQAQLSALQKTQGTPQSADGAFAQRSRDLNRQLEAATAAKQQLQATRDLYWTSYTELSKRLVDVSGGLANLNRVEQVVTGSEEIARQTTSRTQFVLKNVGSALIVTLGLMVLAVVLYELVAPGKHMVQELTGFPGRRRRGV